MIKSILLVVLLSVVLSHQVLQFEIYKSFANDPSDSNRVYLGTLQVRRNIEYEEVSASIQPNFPTLVSEADLQKSTVVLTFVPKKFKDVAHDNKIYKTAVVERLSGSHDQIIGVVVGLDLKIKAINYLEKRSPLQQIRAQVSKMQSGKQEISKIEMAAKKGGPDGNPQQESFFSKYKWPIIIGFVIFYLMNMTGDKGAAQGGQQQA